MVVVRHQISFTLFGPLLQIGQSQQTERILLG
jgi:hypothetical protein